MDRLTKAIENIGITRLLQIDGRDIRLALLLKREDWKHLAAPWWQGKSASIVAVDLDGNFIIFKISGALVLWDHQVAKEIKIANSLSGMLDKLQIDITNAP